MFILSRYILAFALCLAITSSNANDLSITKAEAINILTKMGANTDTIHLVCAFPGRIKRNICSVTCIYNRRIVVEVKGLNDAYTATKNGRRLFVISRTNNATAYKNNGGIADINIDSDCYYEGMKIIDK